MKKQYESVIGLEVHVELATETKIFCGCSTSFGSEPNVNTCPVCLGMPGALPVFNKKVLELGIAVGLAANGSIAQYTKFDRKNYFYPDNPQNYQITQFYLPLCRGGFVEIDTGKGNKRIRLHELHMEEDSGKLIHSRQENITYVDYNRAGIPLLEIVTEPDMRNAEEAVAFLEKLRRMIQYLKASDCKLQEGSMRVDVNLSVRQEGQKELGTRTEMKNLNSFKAIRRAIKGERERQISLLEDGKQIEQETRRFDDGKGVSYPMRFKEEANDYRYFPEPDLVPLKIDAEWIAKIKKKQPELQAEKLIRYRQEYGLPEYDARLITDARGMAELFEACTGMIKKPKQVSNWLMGETMRLQRECGMEQDEIPFSAENLARLIELTERRVITGTVAKEVFAELFAKNMDPVLYVAEHGLAAIEDEAVLRDTVKQVMEANQRSVEDFQNGKEKAIGFLVGQTMKALQGKGNPAKVNEILRELLSPKQNS